MIGKLWVVKMPEGSYVLRLSTQRPGKHYFTKFTLSSLEKNSSKILVQESNSINGLVGLAIECDVVYGQNSKTVSWEVMKLLVGEQFYYVPPEHLQRFNNGEDDDED